MTTLNTALSDSSTDSAGFLIFARKLSFSLPLIWLMFSASRGLEIFQSRAALEAVETDALQGSPEGFVYLGLMVAGMLLLARSRFDWRGFVAGNPVLVSIYLLILLSTVWSEVPMLTVKRFIKAGGVLVMVLLFLQDAGEKKVIRFLELFVWVYLTWSLLYILFFPSLGVGMDSMGERELIGVAYTKNSLAQVALVGCMVFGFSAFTGARMRVLPLCLVAFCLVSIIVVDSVTCLLLGLLTLFGFLAYRGIGRSCMEFRSLVLLLVVVLAALLLLLFLFHFGEGALSMMLSGFGRDTTLTGRVDLWRDVLAIGNENWLLGKGYGAFWFEGMGNDLWDKYVWQPNQAHQGFLDIYVQLGVVGLGFVVVWVARVLAKLVHSLGTGRFDAFRMLLIVVLLTHNMVESSLFRLNHINWFLFLLGALSLPGGSVKFSSSNSFGGPQQPAEAPYMEE